MTRHVTYECDLCHLQVETDDGDLPTDWKELADGRHLDDECVDAVADIINAIK